MTTTVSWAAPATKGGPPTLAAIRAYALAVSKDLDPGSRYVQELLAVIDASASVEDYLRRLCDPEQAATFRQDGSIPSAGERGFSWVDQDTWRHMDPFEQTLSNLLTGETRMMWAGESAIDWLRLPDVLRGASGAARVLSVPCSTGKEPFSIVIAALRAGLDVRVVGVDRQAAYVERARTGRLIPHHRDLALPAALTSEELRDRVNTGPRAEQRGAGAPATEDVSRWLPRRGREVVVAPDVLSRCTFETGDVLTGALPAGPFDLVSCRNLLGYFRGASLEAAVRNVAARVRRGGALLVDPFVCDGAPMAPARAVLAELGFTRLRAGESYFGARA